MQKKLGTLLAVLLTGLLMYAAAMQFPFQNAKPPAARLSLVRVWMESLDGDTAAWLRKRAKTYEKETGMRVYLRSVASVQDENGSAPDLLISEEAEQPVAWQGYALFIRDETAVTVTPVPTSALFLRPSPTPGPSPTPAPTLGPAKLEKVLCPAPLIGVLPGTVLSVHPAEDMKNGKGQAAILTAKQAAALPFGVQASPLQNGSGKRTIGGQAYSPAGEALLEYLQQKPSQTALAEHGLYSPFFQLYAVNQPVYAMIESSLHFYPAE